MKGIPVFISLGLMLGGASAIAAEQTWTGQISDSMCGADHGMMKHEGKKVSSRDCTLECVKDGGKYVFVSKGKVYEIENQDSKELQQHAGHTVKLTGDMSADGKTITASKIVMPTSGGSPTRNSTISNTSSRKTKTKVADSSGTDSTPETHGGQTPPVAPAPR